MRRGVRHCSFAHLPEEVVDQMSISLEHTTARMRQDGKERAATLAGAVTAIPSFRSGADDH